MQYVESTTESLRFIYSKEQKEKAAILTLPPYNIQKPELAIFIQAPKNTLSMWIRQYKKEHNMPTQEQHFKQLIQNSLQA